MKKYITPSIEIQNIDVNEDLMLLTISSDGPANPGEDLDTKAEADWNIWSDDEE